jgi:hypothetical protein
MSSIRTRRPSVKSTIALITTPAPDLIVTAATHDPLGPDDCPIPSPFRTAAKARPSRKARQGSQEARQGCKIDKDAHQADMECYLVTLLQVREEADALLANYGTRTQAVRDVAVWRTLFIKAADDLRATLECCGAD